MKKEFVDFIGSLLFNDENDIKLQLKSEKQFSVGQDGRFEKEQSVITDIIVGKDAIYMQYRLPDGHIVTFENAIVEVDCQVNNDYTVGSIVYKTTAAKNSRSNEAEGKSLFILRCDDDNVKFFGEMEDRKKASRICYEITG